MSLSLQNTGTQRGPVMMRQITRMVPKSRTTVGYWQTSRGRETRRVVSYMVQRQHISANILDLVFQLTDYCLRLFILSI